MPHYPLGAQLLKTDGSHYPFDQALFKNNRGLLKIDDSQSPIDSSLFMYYTTLSSPYKRLLLSYNELLTPYIGLCV